MVAIAGIVARDLLARARRVTLVDRGDGARVLGMADVADARIGERTRHLVGLVGGGVVRQDDFVIVIAALRQNAIDAFLQIRSRVVV